MIIYIDKDPEKKDFKKLNNYTKYRDIAISKLDYISLLIDYLYKNKKIIC